MPSIFAPPPKYHEQQTKNLKQFLGGWRVALLPIKSILLWEQKWYPGAIVAFASILYFLIWMMDLNSLSTLALIGILINSADFLVSVICNNIYDQSTWNDHDEKVFEDICRSIVYEYNKTLSWISSFYSLRATSPYKYYLLTLSILFAVSWLVSSINNIFLLYILSTCMLLWPGFQCTPIFKSISSISLFSKKPVKTE